jgi:hypothetical protein
MLIVFYGCAELAFMMRITGKCNVYSFRVVAFYTGIAIGFIVGFWGVYGSLMLKSS